MNEPEWLDEALELRERQLSYAKIGQRVGASRNEVYYWLRVQSGSLAATRRDCAYCGETFDVKQMGQRFCSHPCALAAPRTDEQRSKQSATLSARRQREANPNFRHGRRSGARNRKGERQFRDTSNVCRAPWCPEKVAHQHHVTYRQHVKREDGDVWDSRNALGLCPSCHSSHHRRGRVLPWAALRDENIAFAVDLFGPAAFDYFRRYYGNDGDPRVLSILDVAAA